MIVSIKSCYGHSKFQQTKRLQEIAWKTKPLRDNISTLFILSKSKVNTWAIFRAKCELIKNMSKTLIHMNCIIELKPVTYIQKRNSYDSNTSYVGVYVWRKGNSWRTSCLIWEKKAGKGSYHNVVPHPLPSLQCQVAVNLVIRAY